MKKFDYSQARKRVEFATAVITLATAIVEFANAVLPLLGVAFNYSEQLADAKLS